jgi:general stress protein 26
MERPAPSRTPTDDHAERSDASDHPLDELVNEGDVVMLTTMLRGHLTSRPLTVAGLGAGTLLFLVDSSADWVAALDAPAEVNASISTRRNDWVSVTGAATVTNDHEAIARLWSPAAGAYFDGADDPRIRVLQLHMESGEYWSAPGAGPLGRLVSLVSAAVGSEAGAGERGRVTP